MLTSTPVKGARPDDGIARSVTEYPALRLSKVKRPGAMGGCFISRKGGSGGVDAGRMGAGAELGAAVPKGNVESFAPGGIWAGGVNGLGAGGFCAVTQIGQSRKEKAILYTVRMR